MVDKSLLDIVKRDALLYLGVLLMSLGGALAVQGQHVLALVYFGVSFAVFGIRILMKKK
jgi:hypothetical protein